MVPDTRIELVCEGYEPSLITRPTGICLVLTIIATAVLDFHDCQILVPPVGFEPTTSCV